MEVFQEMGNERHIAKIQALSEKKKTANIIKYAVHKDPELRCAAAAALGTIAQDESYNQLVLMTRDPELSVRKAAVAALGVMGRKAGADHVRHVMTHDTDPELIKICETAVSQIVNSTSR